MSDEATADDLLVGELIFRSLPTERAPVRLPDRVIPGRGGAPRPNVPTGPSRPWDDPAVRGSVAAALRASARGRIREPERPANDLHLAAHTGLDAAVTQLAFDAWGRRFVTLDDAHRVTLRHAAGGLELRSFDLRRIPGVDTVRAARLSTDGAHVLLLGAASVHRWESQTRTTQRIAGEVRDAVFAAREPTTVVLGGDRITVVRAAPGASEQLRGASSVVALSPRGDLALLSAGGRPQVWGIARPSLRCSLDGGGVGVRSAAFSGDGTRVVTLHDDDVARVWRLPDGAMLAQVERVSPDARVDLGADGARMLVVAGGVAALYDLSGREPAPVAELTDALKKSGAVSAAAQSPCARRPLVVVATVGGGLLAFDPARPRSAVWRVEARRVHPVGVSFEDDGRWSVRHDDGSAHVWDAQRGAVTVRRGVRRGPWTPSRAVTRAPPPGAPPRAVTTATTHAAAPRVSRYEELAVEPGTPQVLRRTGGGVVGLYLPLGSPLRRARYDAIGRRVVLEHENGLLAVMDVARPSERGPLGALGLRGVLRARVFVPGCVDFDGSPDGETLVTARRDGVVSLWRSSTGQEVCACLSHTDGRWVVVDPHLRFDASDPGAASSLHWVQGAEVISLRQLRERCFDPGLLAKRLGRRNTTLRALPAERGASQRARVTVPPEVSVAVTREGAVPVARITISSEPEAVGEVRLRLNGRELFRGSLVGDGGRWSLRRVGASPIPATLGVDADTGAPEVRLDWPITENAWLRRRSVNHLDAEVRTPDETLTGRGGVAAIEPEASPGAPRRLFALLVGVSDYAGDSNDLTWADDDAKSLAIALGFLATAANAVRVTELRSGLAGAEPTRGRIRQALDALRDASADDVVVVFLSGHGATHTDGGVTDYYFLTAEASSLSLADAAVRANATISASELMEALAAVPALDQLVVLDTCRAGQFIDDVGEASGAEDAATTLDALVQRSGTHVLAGSSPDGVSWESGLYCQGLLTWAILHLLHHRDAGVGGEVEAHALCVGAQALVRRIRAAQQPRLMFPPGAPGFLLGVLDETTAKQVPLAMPLPPFARSAFHDARDRDPIDLGGRFDEALAQAMPPNPDAWAWFVDERPFESGNQLVGHYDVSDQDVVTLTAYLDQFGDDLAIVSRHPLPREFPLADLDQVIVEILADVRTLLPPST